MYSHEQGWKRRWMWILAVIVPIAACLITFVIQSPKSQPATTPTPELSRFTGRLILLGISGISEKRPEFYSLSGDSTGLAPIWGELSSRITLSSSPTYQGGEKLVSPDGKLAALCGVEGIAVVDLLAGDLIQVIQGQIDCDLEQGAFSPDNRYLVIGSDTDLWLLDLSRQSEPVKLYTAPSARYGSSGSVRARGSAYRPLWLEPATLLYSSYEGAMPEEVETVLGGNVTLKPNSTSRVEVKDGKVASSRMISRSEAIASNHSGMISFTGGVLAEGEWLDRNALKNGRFEGYRPFPAGSAWVGQAPMYISPDGRYAVFMERPSSFVFHLVEIGSAAEIGSATLYTDHTLVRHHCLDAAWSPDMQSLACRSLDNDLFILSFARGKTIGGLVDMSKFSEWLLLTWLP